MNISPLIQSRVRQLLGLTGGPSVEAIEAIQPVAIIAGYQESRQPQLESGDMIVRKFHARATQGATAVEYSKIGIRCGDQDSILWITDVFVHNPNPAAPYVVRVGITPNMTFLAYGTACFDDLRLPVVDIGSSPIAVGRGSSGTASVFLAPIEQSMGTWTNLHLSTDFILTSDKLYQLTVQNMLVNEPLFATFARIVFQRAP